MMVYIFDHKKQVRRIAPKNSVTDLVHDEAAGTLDATVSEDLMVQNGEHIGFCCVDGHFRLFTVTKRDNDDGRHQTILKATDAIIQELKEMIVEELQQLDAGLKTAIEGLIAASHTTDVWEVTGEGPDRLEKSRAYFASVWTMLETYKTLYEWRIIPYYIFKDGKISKRVIELQEDVAVFRGRILTSRKDASNVHVVKNNPPVTRLYGVGASTSTGDLQTNLTFTDVEWSVAKGDPVDKPKGQSWVEDPAAAAKYGLHAAPAPFNDVDDPAELLQKTWELLQKVKEPTCTVEATIQDLERIPGNEHQIIRLGDLVPIRLRNAAMETARVVGIKRNYIQHWLTKLTIGEKTANVQSQVSGLIVSAAHTFERLTIFKNRFHEDEALIQLNAEHIQLNATTILEHAEQILLKAEKEDLDAVYVFLDGVTETLTLHGKNIDINGEKIALQAEELSLKVDKTYVDNLVANYATVEELNSVKAWISDLEGGLGTLTVLNAGTLNATDTNTTFLSASSFTFAGSTVSKRDITMGDVSAGAVLSTGELNLNHSHKINVNDDGTLGIGEVSSSGGSFNIADTQFYKNGVEAAYRSVTVYGPTVDHVEHPGGTSRLMRVYMQGKASNGAVSSVVSELISAQPVYDAGYSAGYEAGLAAGNQE